MESNRSRDSLHEQLHEIERGETAAWVVYPPTPVWWAIGFGGWAGAFALVIGFGDGPLRALAQLGLVVVVGGLAWLAGEQVSVWLAAAIAAVGAWVVIAWYEHEYAAIAARVRERLA